ncbi:RNA polymerase sigma factor [Saccharopolyspora subtropica]|uniref:RNA polymerase sigma factor n=1 Tax=Saccharopolyspora thermophila TaxID=89367 RepID=A0A917NA86_9PSEU|nr:sigma-70 family RNA polymerase sigma factor [Saccharopolyspora subtropica]GGI77241.1 RNA polymerase sigma factor [Saccharopolyspora subtropica]
MATVPADVHGPSDGELLDEVRSGSSAAYAQLYERHVGAAYNMARQLARSPAEADDLVSEAFAKVLDTLRAGRGPTSAFRAYLLTALRHTAYDRTRRERKVQLADDLAEVSGADLSVPFTDTTVDGLERTLAAHAFARLPERWQTVLWHIEIEGQTPAQVAPLLGLSPNGVSALAYRAREGLRQAYLQVHLGQLADESGAQRCRATVDRLGAWTRGGLSKRETAQVEAHLDGCDRCRALAAELADVNGTLRVVIAPLVLGATATSYLAVSSSGAAACGASGAAGAATAVPRQTAVAGLSAAALVAAVAFGLTAGEQQSAPIAAAPPPPARVQPPAPLPPAPQRPPARPAPRPLTPQPPQAPPPPGVTATLDATGPGGPLQLVPDGDPVPLPITVHNIGTGPSAPVSTTVSLPPGVTARIPSAVPSGPASTAPQNAGPAVSRTQGPSVRCATASRSVTCTTDRGLQPGESFVFDFQVRADDTASGGEIATHINAGSTTALRLPAIPVVIRPPVDGVEVTITAWYHAPWLGSRITLDVRNTGASVGRVEIVADLPDGVLTLGLPPRCEAQPVDRRIRCAAPLEPGQSFTAAVWVTPLPDHPWPVPAERDHDGIVRTVRIPVTAALGSAGDHDSVEVGLWFPSTSGTPPSSAPRPSTPSSTQSPGPTTRPTPSVILR